MKIKYLKGEKIIYPVRCQIIDIFDAVLDNFQLKTPEASKPHIGKCGLAELSKDGNVKITLDDGNILYGWECWWVKINEKIRR